MNLKKYNFKYIVEEKQQGILRVFDSKEIPFKIERVFTVVNASSGSKRGQHAHKKCLQLLCCISGEVELVCDNGIKKTIISLTPKNEAILVPSGIWAEQNYLINNSVLLVLCDQPYDESDYIRDYENFLKWKGIKK